ncbi:hypothetical protein KK120_08885 [Virgibacillus dakarensis]|nr:hypothetical protein [Virgibacillus dakarensis]MBT2215937.1 hypothetical protein [Virgibacillus dakarensis]
MSEWLSTGEMIDQLKVGEIARNDNDSNTIFVKKSKTGSFYKCFENGVARESVFLVGSFVDSKWRILPKYATFGEAMISLSGNKMVYFHPKKNESISVNKYSTLQGWLSNYTWEQLIEGNWTIEGDN